ncbi:MAG TPA: type II toxin-antitoxin system VapC family toxin [Iamia sp.]
MADDVLLDTHALLWWQEGSEQLGAGAVEAIEGAARILIGPITCWEVAMLVAKGRVAPDRPVARWVDDLVSGTVEVAEITPRIATAAGSLVEFHGDPADRLIYATAATDGHVLVTKDRRMADHAAAPGGVRVAW